MNNLALVLKDRRMTMGLTLTELSAVSGVSTAYLGRIEGGERHPSGRILRKLAKPLGFSEIQLLKEAGFLSQNATDDRLGEVKKQLKAEVAIVADEVSVRIATLYKKIDEL